MSSFQALLPVLQCLGVCFWAGYYGSWDWQLFVDLDYQVVQDQPLELSKVWHPLLKQGFVPSYSKKNDLLINWERRTSTLMMYLKSSTVKAAVKGWTSSPKISMSNSSRLKETDWSLRRVVEEVGDPVLLNMNITQIYLRPRNLEYWVIEANCFNVLNVQLKCLLILRRAVLLWRGRSCGHSWESWLGRRGTSKGLALQCTLLAGKPLGSLG